MLSTSSLQDFSRSKDLSETKAVGKYVGTIVSSLVDEVGESGAHSRKKYKRRFLLHGSSEGKIVYWDMEMNYWR